MIFASERKSLCKYYIDTIKKSNRFPIRDVIFIFFFVDELYYAFIDREWKGFEFDCFSPDFEKRMNETLFEGDKEFC